MSSVPFHMPGGFPPWRYAANGLLNWQVWHKPKEAQWVYIVAGGGGGGGGGGDTLGVGTARDGGGGGGSGAMTRLWIPAVLLPKQLWVSPGMGGLGGAATVGGAVGTSSFVTMEPTTGPASYSRFTLLVAKGGSGGNPGTTNSSGGAGGTVHSTTGTESAPFSLWGIYVAFAGVVGAKGGEGTGGQAGLNAEFGNAGTILCGGSGGGCSGTANTNFAGGTVQDNFGVVLLPGGLAGGGAGNNGLSNEEPPFFTGGTGGGSNGASGVGGRGGDGAPGCGGGGGGGGITGGGGGPGGPGFVWIFCL